MMKIDITNVRLFVFDEKKNFNLDATQAKLGVDIYEKVILIETAEDFDREFKKTPAEQQFILIVHLFHRKGSGDKAKHRGYHTFQKSKIQQKYGIKPTWVSSGPSAEVYAALLDDTGNNSGVYMYSDVAKDLMRGNLPVYNRGQVEAEMRKNKPVKKKTGIFLSHSSKDAQIVKLFQEKVIRDGLSIPSGRIKFTSSDSHGITGGMNIPADLRKFLKNETGLFFQFISKDYLDSRVCLNEEGAAWCLLDDIMFISLIVPSASYTTLGWLKNHNKALDITNKNELLGIYRDRKSFFGEKDFVLFVAQVEEFLAAVKSLPPKV